MVDDKITPNALESDESFNDNDSALGDADLSTQTQTLASSIYNYRVESGRYALIALHRTLLYEHHDFFLASQHPSASAALRRLATKYDMPARM